ncbi:putative RNA-directed DNA polymerase from transposon BS [Trichonephila clavipes]|nr:putative RNA-directed DNA polymerase from transposon BS [Trichonephila clavipes]
MTGTLPPLLNFVVGGGTPGRSYVRVLMDPMKLCPGKGLVLPNKPNVDRIATNIRFLLIPLQNVELSKKSSFTIHKALIGIGGEPKSVKRLRFGDLLIETLSALQTKSFLLANTFLDSPVTISPHKSLNTSRGVISEPDLMSTPESEILEGFSDQGVIQVRRITIKKDVTIIPTKHLILTFNSPKLPPTIKAGYLNRKSRPVAAVAEWYRYRIVACLVTSSIPVPLKTRRVGQRCTLNLSRAETSSRWCEARKLIVPQLVQTYAKAAKPSIVNNSTQTDEDITKIKCPPLNLLQPLSSIPKPNILISTPAISTSSSSIQAELLPSASAKATAVLQPGPPIPMSNDVISNNMFTLIESSSIVSTSLSNDSQPPSTSNTVRNSKQNSKTRIRKRKKELLKKLNEEKIEIKMAPYRHKTPAPTDYTTDEEDIITYDVEEDELEQHPDLVQKDGKKYWKGSLLLTQTRQKITFSQ